MCETLSLTENPCTQPLHKGGTVDGPTKEPEQDDKYNLLFKSVCS